MTAVLADQTLDFESQCRIYSRSWAAAHAKQLPGDFVACGDGQFTAMACRAVDFNATDKRIWYFDYAYFASFAREMSSEEITQVAYLSLDLRIAGPVRAIQHFWPKLVTGAIVVLGGYSWNNITPQKEAIDRFAAKIGSQILPISPGDGLMVKP